MPPNTNPHPEAAGDFALAMEPVQAWAGRVTGLPVVHDWPETAADGGAVLLRPLSIALAPATGPVMRHISSAELTASLLVGVVGLPVWEASGLTAALALDAATDGQWTMGAEAPSTELWQALGHPPVPAFLLSVPVRRLLEHPNAPLVREPLRITPAHLRMVAGRVVAADGQPLSGARVARADGNAPAVVADHRGRFRLPVATDTETPLALSVVTRGTTFTQSVIVPAADDGGDLGDIAVPIPETV